MPCRDISRFCMLFLLAAPLAADDIGGEAEAPASSRPRTDEELAQEDRILELERTVAVLAQELERTRLETTLPEEPELLSAFGLGPAASKVYGVARGLSIGGYGEMNYRNYTSDFTTSVSAATGAAMPVRQNDTMDFLRAVLYVGYKFTDRIVFNSEIEIERADEIFLEFATIDFLLADWVNIKTGLMLLPIGWLNEIHEPNFFYGVNRPDVERFIIPTTWRENGVGIFGSFGEMVHYKLYGVNGLDGSGFSTAGIRGGRQKGSKALANDLGVAGRLDFSPHVTTTLGASFYTGNSGQDLDGPGGELPGARTTLFDVHAQWQWRGLHLRGLFTMAFIDDADQLTEALIPGATHAIADTMLGGYGEIAYDLWGWLSESERTLSPYYRFEYYDTQWDVPSGFSRDDTKRIWSHTVGIQFEPIPNVVVKADYRNRKPDEGKIANEVNLGFGYIF